MQLNNSLELFSGIAGVPVAPIFVLEPDNTGSYIVEKYKK